MTLLDRIRHIFRRKTPGRCRVHGYPDLRAQGWRCRECRAAADWTVARLRPGAPVARNPYSIDLGARERLHEPERPRVEVHRCGKALHIVTDEGGRDALWAVATRRPPSPSTWRPAHAIVEFGVPIYVDSCPCDETPAP